MRVQRILHTTFLVSDLQRSLAFYCGVLGMKVDPSRPDLGFPGSWFSLGDGQIHLMQLPNPDPVSGRPEHGGRDRHTALSVDSIKSLAEALEKNGIAYSRSRSGRPAIFCRDPDGNALEFVELKETDGG